MTPRALPLDAGARPVGLYTLLVALPLLVLVPLMVFSGVLLHLMGEQARETTRRELAATGRALSGAMEREMAHTRSTLRLLAESPALELQHLDLLPLAATAREVTRANIGLQSLLLVDARGQVLLMYPAPVGPLPRLQLAAHHLKAQETNQVVISELNRSPLDGRLSLSITYPVWRSGQIPWLFIGRIDPQHLADVMASHLGGREEAVATLLDPRYRIIARTREMGRFFGQPPSEETLMAVTSAPSGVRRLATNDGNDHLWAWSTTVDGWTTLVGLPARNAEIAVRDSLARLVSVGLSLLLVGLMATLVLARRIVHSVDRMAADAPRLVRGDSLPSRSGVRQLDALHDALAAAGQQVVRALSERDQALEAERTARALADEDNRAKDVFIATLSHELRNPLSPIRAAAAVLRSPQADDSQRQRAVAVIDRQAAAMGRLLEDLLDISRIASGRIVLERREVTLAQVLDSAVEIARPLIEQRGHRLDVLQPPTPLTLNADPLRLSQVFANLLTNAAKYTDPGGHIEVRVEPDPAQGQVRVRVRDTGIGLEPQALEQVFQRFAQVRGELDRSQGGLGIGLSLVRGLVRLHGGWVRAFSEGLGLGSEFVVGLPLPAQAPPPSAPPPPPAPA